MRSFIGLALACALGWSADAPVPKPVGTQAPVQAPAQTRTPAATPKRAIVIPIEQEIDYGLYAFLKRAVAQAQAQHPDVLVFKVNTYGGELQSAFDIVDLIAGVAQCSTYAYVEHKAISAGALISLASNRIAMGHGTTIGDCAPITQGGENGIIMLGEKIQSPLRAKFRTLAERNGYPSLLAEAMVTADLGVVEAYRDTGEVASKTKPAQAQAQGQSPGSPRKGAPEYFTAKQWQALSDQDKAAYKRHTVLVPEGQLLTMTDREAQRLGFSQGSYGSLEEFLAAEGWTRSEDIASNWSEDLVRTVGRFAPILMMIGFGALYLEFKSPGSLLFGVIGVACLALAFGIKYAAGLANHTELLILLAGFLLVAAEVYFFPGTLVAGVFGVFALLIALILSSQSFTVPDPKMPWEYETLINNVFATVGSAVVALLIPFLAARYLLPRLPGPLKIVSDATLANARSVAPDVGRIALGETGSAKTPLRPSGKAVFGGRTVEVSSRGEFIEAGRAVEVCRIEGNKIVVRPKETA